MVLFGNYKFHVVLGNVLIKKFVILFFNSHLAPLLLSLKNRLGINSEANIQSTLKRTKSLTQSDLSDFVFEPENLF